MGLRGLLDVQPRVKLESIFLFCRHFHKIDNFLQTLIRTFPHARTAKYFVSFFVSDNPQETLVEVQRPRFVLLGKNLCAQRRSSKEEEEEEEEGSTTSHARNRELWFPVENML